MRALALELADVVVFLPLVQEYKEEPTPAQLELGRGAVGGWSPFGLGASSPCSAGG